MTAGKSENILNLARLLGERIDALVLENHRLKSENEELRNRVNEKTQQIENQQNEFSEVEHQNKILKLAKHLSSESNDTRLLKLKINELVRDIDKCIAGLSD